MSEIVFGIIWGMMFMGAIWLYIGGKNKGEKEELKNIKIKYKDNSIENFKGTEWETDKYIVKIIDSNTDEYIVKEINLREIKNIGFTISEDHE